MLTEQYEKLNRENSTSLLDRYFNTKTLQRLKGRGMFCGMDFVNIPKLKPIEYYSRFDHSKNVAYTAYKLSDDLKVALAGAFHDVGTLSFSHVNSFKKGDAQTQENDELDIKKILMQDDELLTYLNEDGILIDDVIDPAKYNIIDKPIPTLCLDRLDGILTTCLIWQHTHTFEEIEGLYYMVGYLENLKGISIDTSSERCLKFNGELVISEALEGPFYEDFFKAINVYSKILLSKESRFMMEVLGMTLNYYEDIGIICSDDLFNLSEDEIIAKILDSKYADVYKDITTFDQVYYDKSNNDLLSIISHPKIRQANPLCLSYNYLSEIDGVSGEFYQELNPLREDINDTYKPISGNLSNNTKRILAKYKRHN